MRKKKGKRLKRNCSEVQGCTQRVKEKYIREIWGLRSSAMAGYGVFVNKLESLYFLALLCHINWIQKSWPTFVTSLYLETDERSYRLLQRVIRINNFMSAKTHQTIHRLVLPRDICMIDPLYLLRSILAVNSRS